MCTYAELSPEDELKITYIYETYKEPMYNRAYEALQSREDAETVVWKSMQNIYRYLDLLDSKNAADKHSEYFIMAIAKNTLIQFYRKHKYTL